jgi:hypothetical protein
MPAPAAPNAPGEQQRRDRLEAVSHRASAALLRGWAEDAPPGLERDGYLADARRYAALADEAEARVMAAAQGRA